MTELASPGQLRMSFVRWVLVTVPLIVLIGSAIGIASNSGYSNRWFNLLDLPAIMPPGWLFGVAWTILYILIGLAFAMILNARGARWRGPAIAAFLIQLVANFAWTPVFFGLHRVSAALALILFILAGAIVTTILFGRVRRLAAWLMVPYLVWLGFASVLNFSIDRANPDAESLAVPAARTNIGGSGQ
jgi:translocator protein